MVRCIPECSNRDCEVSDVTRVYRVEYNEFSQDKYLWQCDGCKRVWVA
jgi:hypothetical protein